MKTYLLKDKFTQVEFSCDPDFLDNDFDHSVYVIDRNVYVHFEEKFRKYIREDQLFLFDAIEKNKSLDYLEKIYNFCQVNKVNRSSRIFGIGGGITTDITAFAAGTYMRGCRLHLVPTTFLAMIDSAIGGKTAVNFQGVKNNLGTFYPAEKVYVCTKFISTLPQIEIINGWAEAIKISLINKNDMYQEILDSKRRINPSIIEKAIDLKSSFCTIDPEDKNERRVLNLGHTFGHVIEFLTDFKTPHGIAVALGIRTAAFLSLSEEMINHATFKKINHILDIFDFPTKVELKAEYNNKALIGNILKKDKKTIYTNKKLEINVVVFSGFQKTELKVFPLSKIYSALQHVIK
ncbi:3-dehydroquinate synthase family protein [Candidatus Cloacimonadota bacterium]